MALTTAAIPLPLQQAIDSLPDFIQSIRTTRPGLIRAMRQERQDSMTKFLRAMLLSCSLQHDGAICRIHDEWVKPKTIEELAEQAEISFFQAKRCLADLRAGEYITSKQIKRKNKINGQVEVSPGLRFFTQKFWEELGLWELFQKSMAWAKKYCKRLFIMPFKAIQNLKPEKTFKQAGEVVGKILQTKMFKQAGEKAIQNVKPAQTFKQTGEVVGEVLQDWSDRAAEARYWCNKIFENLRQRK